MRRRPAALALATALTLGLTAAPALAAPGPPVSPSAAAALEAAKPPNFDPLTPSANPVELTSDPRDLGKVTYTYNGQTHTVQDYLNRAAQGFLVLDGTRILDEWYAPGYSKDSLFQSWSMAKSYTADAIGVALGEGKIHSIDDTAGTYVPELADTAYGSVTIRNLLRMASGIGWNETIDDVPLHVGVSLGLYSTLQFAATRTKAVEQGTQFNYTSLNTAVLALVLQKATGKPYYRYLQEKIWGPGGMAGTAYVGNDSHGDALGYCCIYATDRDFARMGKLMLDGGRGVIPASWVSQVGTPSGVSPSYGLGWWIDGTDGYYASGLGGQLIYVSTKYRVVIVKSTFLNPDESETLPAFRAVAAEVARTRVTPPAAG
ncbi:beta-lactamase [Actinomadura verrucosospora]|uniref:Beta-lactamase n=2 Tax=Actinomadura verrucosospora TaxID=46165 RepID=A0A7D3VUJ7_ACTVE|nr:beta-lactamase [Actinomadura verrucosospora]